MILDELVHVTDVTPVLAEHELVELIIEGRVICSIELFCIAKRG